jgi:hypothetical protein
MSSVYDATHASNMIRLTEEKAAIVNKIVAQKIIHQFRHFMMSLDSYSKRTCFDLTGAILKNELQSVSASVFDNTSLRSLLNHWQWNNFERNTDDWWVGLSLNHIESASLMKALKLWVNEASVAGSAARGCCSAARELAALRAALQRDASTDGLR